MADSDGEYDSHGSDDHVTSGKGKGKAMPSRSKGRAQASWEAGATRSYEMHEAPDGSIEGMLGGIEEAGKRKR